MKSIKLTLMADGEIFLPLAHFEILQGIVYNLMSADKALADEIHNKLPGKEKQFKFFCFTDLHGKYRFYDGALMLSAPATWEIRSADDRIIDAIEKGLENKEISVNGQKCRVDSYQISKRKFDSGKVVFEMDTPLIHYVTDRNGFSRYFSPADEEFAKGIRDNVIRKYTSFYGKSPEGEVAVLPLRIGARDKCVTRYKKSFITGYYGQCMVIAPPEVLEFIYYTGLGGKNSMGFGTVKENIYGK
ncbi:MAG: CRISPR-associated endoribonuclease Cas6 [Clostridia bacterium]|nr:CRISPR-associated endoribonuclease Cas6 [Clostridia bacterium]MBR3576327.1 CRISPR-associated endoribonuclease Cas6 [Clostridia bacterium]